MPAPILAYLRGLLQGHNITATFLEEEFGYSHDRITRFLQRKFDWQTFIWKLILKWFGNLNQGFLIIDDTVLAKPYGKKFAQASYCYSSCLDRVVFGYHLVFIVWTNGEVTIPLGWKHYQKRVDGKTKTDLALELLQEVKDGWDITPHAVLMDSWYASEKILDLIHSFDWYFVTQIKSNRVVNACLVRDDLINTGDCLVGPLTGTLLALVFKHEGKYFATNQPLWPQDIVLQMYGIRWKIEEVFRFLKQALHLQACQARSLTAQQTHLASCVMAYLILEKERQNQPDQSLYAIKNKWMLNRKYGYHRINSYAVKVLSA